MRAGRDPAGVRIVVAAKTFPAEAVRAVVEAGARDIGENYVQEARRKRAELDRADVRWHLIGRLQRNKAKTALDLFDVIHSLDRLDLATDLDRAARAAGRRANCLVEVNLGSEKSKGGVSPGELERFLGQLAEFPDLLIEGLMAVPPPATRPEDSRLHFAELFDLRERLSGLRLPNARLKELSMGMSADFEAAIEEGATIVRIGTAIFGTRTGTG
ncbi:MAG: dependent protein [Candidatus Binatota bacterium]|nr:dependent protein [Candidatus Binatota bacterium]